MLFTSCPAYGHLLPMLPLIRAASRAGHQVRVATGPDLVDALATRGVPAHPVGPPWAASWSVHEAIWADPAGSEEGKMLAGAVALFGAPALARLTDLSVMARQWHPDLVVHEVLEMAGPLLSRRLTVPAVVHGFGPMFPSYAELIGPVGDAIGEAGLWGLVAAEQALDICPPALQPDGPRPWPRAVPLRPTAGEPGPLPPRVAAALRKTAPLAYFTLGTVKNDTTDLATALAALADYDGTVVAATGRALRRHELGPVPANVVLAQFVPQTHLLERAELLVSHCGSGTMLGALVHGVPQVALPRGTDQPQNAALLARAGAGVIVAPQDYAIDTIRAALARVTGEPGYRTRAGHLREQITRMPDADTVWAHLQA